MGRGRGETNMDVSLFLMLQLKFVAAHVFKVANPNPNPASGQAFLSSAKLLAVWELGGKQSLQTQSYSLTNISYCPHLGQHHRGGGLYSFQTPQFPHWRQRPLHLLHHGGMWWSPHPLPHRGLWQWYCDHQGPSPGCGESQETAATSGRGEGEPCLTGEGWFDQVFVFGGWSDYLCLHGSLWHQ